MCTRVFLTLLLLAIASVGLSPAQAGKAHCDAERLERDVRHFSDDHFAGRGLGSPELEEALHAVAERFTQLGLEPAFPERATTDDPLPGYLQPFKPEGYPGSWNVIGVLRGSGGLSPGAVVVGAHVDHLGTDPSLSGDQIFNGADDNASGVAALLELTRTLSEPKADAERPLRDVIFIAFSAEESGLLGSKHYIAHPVLDHTEVIAMINFDEVGRLQNDQLILFGTGTAKEFPATLRGLNASFGFDLVLNEEGAGGSDHTSFFMKDIPVLHFFTGTHADYSKVSDEADKVNYAGLKQVAGYAAELTRYLRYRERPLTFVASGREEAEKLANLAKTQGKRKASLGFAPDFAGQGKGVKIGAVTPGGCAEAAGILAGDVLLAIDGEEVASLADYAMILRMHQPGDQVEVQVLRGDETLLLTATLQGRK